MMKKNDEVNFKQVLKKKKGARVTLRFILTLLLFFATLFIFVAIADEIVIDHDNSFDQNISQALLPLVSVSATEFMTVVTFFGSSGFLFPAYIVLIAYYLLRKKSRLAMNIAMIGLSSTGILFLFKDTFKRHRPPDPIINNVTGFSFPSGHSFSSFTFYGLLIYLLWKADITKALKIIISVFLFALAATIAFSRVYLRVHYPSDAVAGFCLSVIWMIISLWILHKAEKELVASKNNVKK